MLKTGDWSQNILLEPNDIVFIPPTPAAWLGHRVAEILFPVQPLVQAYVAPAYLSDLNNAYDGDSQVNANFSGQANTGNYVPR